MAVNGNNIYISSGTTTTSIIATTRSNELSASCETLEICNPDSSEWKKFLTGRKEWGFTVNWLIGNLTDIQNLLYIGNKYTISVVGRAAANTKTRYLRGDAICTQCKVTATRGNLAIGSFSFKGTGSLSTV